MLLAKGDLLVQKYKYLHISGSIQALPLALVSSTNTYTFRAVYKRSTRTEFSVSKEEEVRACS
jgi:hypothetical protein